MTAFKLDILPNYQHNFRHIFIMKTLNSGHHQTVRVLTLQWLQFLFSYNLVLLYHKIRQVKLLCSESRPSIANEIHHHQRNTVEFINHKLRNALHLNDSEVYLQLQCDHLITVMLKISVIKYLKSGQFLKARHSHFTWW